MIHNETNTSIGCTVSDCEYHDSSDYCTLEQIQVVKNNTMSNVTSKEATDCGSYESKGKKR